MPKPNPDLFSRELHFEVVPRCTDGPHGVEGDVVGMFNPPDEKNYVMEYVAVPADEFEIIKASYTAMNSLIARKLLTAEEGTPA